MPVHEGEPRPITVVAIGASAGGLEALTAILRALPIDIDMAFMLIQHLDPKRHSILPELLSKATKIPVLEALDSMKIQSNRVYVMPSNVDIAITDGHFGLRPRVTDRNQHFLPIDIFMRSLAVVRKSQAIGVILSGTASDGTAGVEAIRAAGGVTFAQDPVTAKFDGMPRSAIDSGSIDFVMSPEEIATELAWMSLHPNGRRTPKNKREEPKDDDHAFDAIVDLVSAAQGADFTKYKPSTIQRRTRQRMASLGIVSLAAYLEYLGLHPEELARLSNHILIPVTEFFRNPETFDELTKTVFPVIAEHKSNGVLRLWVVACSSGEEVYSLAITLLEFLEGGANGLRIQIFGTDINEKGIGKARTGIYSENTLKNVTEERLAKFFTKVPGGYQVNKVVRSLCVFARQDVTRDPPFSNLDLISCRNFLIYVQPELQQKIISTFHYSLSPHGFLLLGSAESAASYPDMFTPLSKKSKIYSKKALSQRQQRTFKTSKPLTVASALTEMNVTPHLIVMSDAAIELAADRILLREYCPAGVIVSNALEILHFRGRTNLYLEPMSGRANLSLLRMVREELAIPLRAAIASSRKKNAPVTKRNVAFEHSGKRCVVNLSVTPLGESSSVAERSFLILFIEAKLPSAREEGESKRGPRVTDDDAQETLLTQKRELRAARALLRENLAAQEALREDYQSANEELLSANEELQSTNEELETSKEELESTNEELTTVNDELNSNNATLNVLGNDLRNLLDSTVIPVVMVDSGLCIRRTTAMAEAIFKVLPSDIGRPITDIRPDLDIDLKPLLATVVRDIVTIEREVQDQAGHWYRLQIRPYKTLDNRIDGAVLVLMDIDLIKKRNQELTLAIDFARSIIETMPEPVLVLNAELQVLMANRAFYKAFEVEPESTLNRPVYDLGDGQWNKPDLRVLLEEVLPLDRDFFNHEVIYDFPEIGVKSFMLSGRYMLQEPETAPLILLSLTDITKRKKIEAALVQSEKLAIASRLAASIAHEINNPLEAITNLLYLAANGDDVLAAKEFAAQALEEVGRVSHITQQTLKFYRQATAPSVIQVAEIFDSLLVLYHGKVLAKNISVDCQFREVPSMMCLAGDLRQILANVIINAIDATPSGGLLTIRVRQSVDWRNHERPGIRATIADSGIGMDSKTRKQIYEPFFTTKNTTGTGLGMWVSAQLVERLQGSLHLRSTTRRGRSGTVFSLFVPLEQSQVAVTGPF
ncbi:MAG: PAS domain-containing protein [Acidobacteriota bacterium]|nr:PAS domain-containing protein [Acidobacteriota bacterium]